ncbi:MAG TPA: hypothetical protein VF476_08970 [Chitinophagaceae bacterium]
MERFSLVLKNDKIRQYDLLAILIAIINSALLLYTAYYASSQQTRIISVVGGALVISFLAFHFFKPEYKQKKGYFLQLALFICLLTWVATVNFAGFLVNLSFFSLYNISRKPLIVNFYIEQITISSFPKKNIRWEELNNVILKDGLLTIDLKTNKIIQGEIVNSSYDINEADFNDFCKTQLKASATLTQ